MSWQGTDQLREQLLALADGELPLQDRPELLKYLAEHPEASEWLAEQNQLWTAMQRELTEGALSPPASLRSAIERMSVRPRPRVRSVHLNWVAAAAAMLLLTWLIFRGGGAKTDLVLGEAPVIPASVVSHASRVHADCSRLEERLHADPFPVDRGELSADVEHDLHSSHPWPDLSSMGFHFTGAGPCGDPLADAIHLLYHAERPGSHATISVFVRPFNGQFALNLGKVYSASVPQSPFPMLAWRSDKVVYFLLADDADTEQNAFKIIAAAQHP